MRTVDISTLKPLGGEGRGPWLMSDGRLLRVSSGNHPIRTEGEAREALAAYRAAAATAGTSAGYEVVALDGGFGVVVGYVEGIALGVHMVIGSYAPDEAGRAMGELLRGLHGAHMRAGRDWNATFRRWTSDLIPFLPADTGERLSGLVAAVPEADCLLHGDFHVGNVVVGGGELRLIDIESAGFGHPVFDLAIARSRILGNATGEAKRMGIDERAAERVAGGVWRGMLAGYFAGGSVGGIGELERRIEVLSELERCCFSYGVGSSGPPDAENAEGRRRLRIERLAQLLSRIDRLDF